MSDVVKLEFDPKNMPFRRLGSSGLRVPLFSLGGCTLDGLIIIIVRRRMVVVHLLVHSRSDNRRAHSRRDRHWRPCQGSSRLVFVSGALGGIARA